MSRRDIGTLMAGAGRSRLADRAREEGEGESGATWRLAARRVTVSERERVIEVEAGGTAISDGGVLIRKQASLRPEVVGREAEAWTTVHVFVFESSLAACHAPG
jgi:hypothetical protein